MRMKSLFDRAPAAEIKDRLARLTPQTRRLWGKMSAAQMLAHCSAAMEVSLGDKVVRQVLLGKLFGRIAKGSLLSGKPMGKSLPTAKEYVIANDRDLDLERQRLTALIDRFQAGGPEGCTKFPHSFFGKMPPEEWSALNYIHLDHHLQQFGL